MDPVLIGYFLKTAVMPPLTDKVLKKVKNRHTLQGTYICLQGKECM